MSEALDRLTALYADPPSAPADTPPPVRYIGHDVPREVLLAAGFDAFRIGGRPGLAALADVYCGSSIDEVSRSQLGRILSGEFADSAGLVVSGDCEGSVRLFLYLREIQRLEPAAGVPRFTFVDLLHLPARTSAVYNRARLDGFIAELERWSGRSISDAELAAQVAVGNRVRELMRRVMLLRSEPAGPRLSGQQALQILGAGFRTPPRRYLELLEQLMAESAGLPRLPGIRVFLTGSSHDQPAAYAAIESRGAVIVGEDHDWGALTVDSPVREGGDVRAALVDAYSHGAPASAGYGIAERAAYTASAAVTAGAQLVLAWLRDGDDAPPWDIAAQRDALALEAVPLVVLPAQPYSPPFDSGLDGLIDDAISMVLHPVATA